MAALFCFSATPILAQSDRPVAIPDVKAGDRWTYRRMDYAGNQPTATYDLRVTFAGRDAIHCVSVGADGGETDVTYTSEWNDVVSDRGVVNLRDQGELQFPLFAGATYKLAWELESPRFNQQSGRHERTVKVVGWEDVSVPAGRFRALKIVSEGTHWPFLRYNIASPGTVLDTYWYVPEVKRWVKYVHESSRPVLGGRGVHEREKSGEELMGFDVR